MSPMLCPQRRIFEEVFERNVGDTHARSDSDGPRKESPPKRILTDEEVYLVGWARDFCGKDGRQMYMRTSANRGSQLRRAGATEACIFCGMPALPGTTAFAHIHWRDLHLSPYQDPTRVFCLCWHHHHGWGYIATIELLRAEEFWIENKR